MSLEWEKSPHGFNSFMPIGGKLVLCVAFNWWKIQSIESMSPDLREATSEHRGMDLPSAN
jgi:hypothetical protein